MSLPRATKRLPVFLLVSSYAPPMAGGARPLFLHLTSLSAARYVVLTSFRNFAASALDPATWLPARYASFDDLDPPQPGAPVAAPRRARFPLLDALERAADRAHARLRQPLSGGAALTARGIRVGRVLLAGLIECRRVRPSMIVAVSDMGPAMIGGYLLSLATGVPLVVYFFDLFADNYLLPADRFLARRFEPLLLSRAAAVIVTNEATREFYERKYSRCPRVTIVRNSSDSAPRDLDARPHVPSAPYRIVFSGHVYWPQERCVRNLLVAMDLLADLPVELELYVLRPTDELKAEVARRPRVRLSAKRKEELPPLLESATLLFLPLSWETPAPEIVRTASPAKLADYLAAGTPILVHAPADAFVSRLVGEERCGIVVSEDDPHALAARIRRYLSSELATAANLAERAVALFRRDFDPIRNASALAEVLAGDVESTAHPPIPAT